MCYKYKLIYGIEPCKNAANNEGCKHRPWSRKHSILFALDALTNAVIVTPLCVTLWWSVWDLFYNFATVEDFNAYPNIGLWILIMTGSFGKFAMYLLQFFIRPYLNVEKRSKRFIAVILRIEMYIIFLLSMAVWVGVWTLLDKLSGINGTSTIVCLGVSLPGLITLRSLNCSVWALVKLYLDSDQKPFHYRTRFMTSPHNNQDNMRGLLLYIIDCIITIPVIDGLLIAYWRAGFNILNLYLLPQDPKLSAWITIIIGYITFFAFIFLQFPIVHITKKLTSPWQRLPWKAGYWIVTFLMVLCIWRGIWKTIILYSRVGELSKPLPNVVLFIAHICIAGAMFFLNIFINGCSTFGMYDDACLDGRDLLINNILPTVSVSI